VAQELTAKARRMRQINKIMGRASIPHPTIAKIRKVIKNFSSLEPGLREAACIQPDQLQNNNRACDLCDTSQAKSGL
jgi:hypothetical protein